MPNCLPIRIARLKFKMFFSARVGVAFFSRVINLLLTHAYLENITLGLFCTDLGPTFS